MGMITPEDVVIALSNSGTSEEVLTIVPLVKRQGAKLIAITGRPESALALQADRTWKPRSQKKPARSISRPPRAPPPRSRSATLAVALLNARGFAADDFARSHPGGGALDAAFFTRVGDVMRRADSVPTVSADAPVTQALLAMTAGGMGMTAIVGPDGEPIGIFTDGDLRRVRNAAMCAACSSPR